MQPSVRSLWGNAFAKQLAVNHVVLMVMCSGSNYWPGAVCIHILISAHIHVYIYTYKSIYIYIYMYIYTHMYVYIYICKLPTWTLGG